MSAANDLSNDARKLKDQAAASAERVGDDAHAELAKLRAQVERLMQERVTPVLADAADQVQGYAVRALIGRLMGGNTYVYPRDRH